VLRNRPGIGGASSRPTPCLDPKEQAKGQGVQPLKGRSVDWPVTLSDERPPMETLEGRLLDSTKNMFARIVVRQHGRGSGFRPRPHSGGPGHTGCPLLGGPLWTILNRAGCHLSHLSFLKLSVIPTLHPLTGQVHRVMSHEHRAPTPHHRPKAQRYPRRRRGASQRAFSAATRS
jgi:hypothetical protein